MARHRASATACLIGLVAILLGVVGSGVDIADQEIFIDVDGRATRAIVTTDALHLLWGASSGPQTAAGLVAENLPFLTRVAVLLLEEGKVEDDGSIVIDQDALAG